PGMLISITTTSGSSSSIICKASAPLFACPTTSMSSSRLMILDNPPRNTPWSAPKITLMGMDSRLLLFSNRYGQSHPCPLSCFAVQLQGRAQFLGPFTHADNPIAFLRFRLVYRFGQGEAHSVILHR